MVLLDLLCVEALVVLQYAIQIFTCCMANGFDYYFCNPSYSLEICKFCVGQSLEDEVVSATILRLASLQSWHSLSYGRFQVRLE